MFFFAFYGTYAGGEGVKMGKNEKYTAFFGFIEDSGCKFKLNFDGGGGQKW